MRGHRGRPDLVSAGRELRWVDPHRLLVVGIHDAGRHLRPIGPDELHVALRDVERLSERQDDLARWSGEDRAVRRRGRLKLRVGQRDERQRQGRQEHRDDETSSASPAPSCSWDHARSLRSKSGIGRPAAAIAPGTCNRRPHADQPVPEANTRRPTVGRLGARRVAIPAAMWGPSRQPKRVRIPAQVGDVLVDDDPLNVFHRSLLHVRWISNSWPLKRAAALDRDPRAAGRASPLADEEPLNVRRRVVETVAAKRVVDDRARLGDRDESRRAQ